MRVFLLCVMLAPAAFAQLAVPVAAEGSQLSAVRGRVIVEHDDAAWVVAQHPDFGLSLVRCAADGAKRAGPWHVSSPMHGSGVLGAALGRVFYEIAGASDSELWCSDGTPGGAVRVDTQPSYAPHFVEFNSRVYFFAQDLGFTQCRLRSASGEAGSAQDLIVMPGRAGGLARLRDRLFFIVCADSGVSVYSGDGTASGNTTILHSPQVVGVNEQVFLGVHNSLAWFTVRDEFGALHLYRSDGTVPGTFAVAARLPTFFPGAIGSTLFFNGYGLQTWPVAPKHGDTPGLLSPPEGYVAPGEVGLAGGVYYCTRYLDHIALWRTDGVITTRVWQRPDPGYGLVPLAAVGDKLLMASDSDFGLWWHQAGTVSVAEMRVHFSGSPHSKFWSMVGRRGDTLLVTDEQDRLWSLNTETPRPSSGGCVAGAGSRLPLAAIALPWMLRRGRKARAAAR